MLIPQNKNHSDSEEWLCLNFLLLFKVIGPENQTLVSLPTISNNNTNYTMNCYSNQSPFLLTNYQYSIIYFAKNISSSSSKALLLAGDLLLATALSFFSGLGVWGWSF